jgi:two-component system, chemotaxis family, response regulator Rcp1
MTQENLNGRAIEILLVEDNEGDARLAFEALRDSKIRNAFHHVWDGEQAMAFLRREGDYATMPRPDLILLDLNLPRMDGREVLAEIKDSSDFKRIPVVILTTSSADEDVLRSYDLHANCYITKPVNMMDFMRVVTAIRDFWVTIVKLPVSVA